MYGMLFLVLFLFQYACCSQVAKSTKAQEYDSFSHHFLKYFQRLKKAGSFTALNNLVKAIKKKPHKFSSFPMMHILPDIPCLDYRHFGTEEKGMQVIRYIFENCFVLQMAMSDEAIFSDEYLAFILPGYEVNVLLSSPLATGLITKIPHEPYQFVQKHETLIELQCVTDASEVFEVACNNDLIIVDIYAKPRETVEPCEALLMCVKPSLACTCGKHKKHVFDQRPFEYNLHDLDKVRQLNDGDMRNFTREHDRFAQMIQAIKSIADRHPGRYRRIYNDFFPDSYVYSVRLPKGAEITAWELHFDKIQNPGPDLYAYKADKPSSCLKPTTALDHHSILLESTASVGKRLANTTTVAKLLILENIQTTTAFERYKKKLAFMNSRMALHLILDLLECSRSAKSALKVASPFTNLTLWSFEISRADILIIEGNQAVRRGAILLFRKQGVLVDSSPCDGIASVENDTLFVFCLSS